MKTLKILIPVAAALMLAGPAIAQSEDEVRARAAAEEERMREMEAREAQFAQQMREAERRLALRAAPHDPRTRAQLSQPPSAESHVSAHHRIPRSRVLRHP